MRRDPGGQHQREDRRQQDRAHRYSGGARHTRTGTWALQVNQVPHGIPGKRQSDRGDQEPPRWCRNAGVVWIREVSTESVAQRGSSWIARFSRIGLLPERDEEEDPDRACGHASDDRPLSGQGP